MKKRILAVVLAGVMALSLAGCMSGQDDAGMGMENDGMENSQQDGETDQNGVAGDNADTGTDTAIGSGMQQNAAQRVSTYKENDVEFDVPESWRDNFMAVAQDHNQDKGDQGYSTVDFYYTTPDSDPFKIMTIGRFSKSAWESLTQTTQDAKDKMLGTSKDGEWVYSLNYDENDLSDNEMYLKVKEEARKLKDKIKITK